MAHQKPGLAALLTSALVLSAAGALGPSAAAATTAHAPARASTAAQRHAVNAVLKELADADGKALNTEAQTATKRALTAVASSLSTAKICLALTHLDSQRTALQHTSAYRGKHAHLPAAGTRLLSRLTKLETLLAGNSHAGTCVTLAATTAKVVPHLAPTVPVVPLTGNFHEQGGDADAQRKPGKVAKRTVLSKQHGAQLSITPVPSLPGPVPTPGAATPTTSPATAAARSGAGDPVYERTELGDITYSGYPEENQVASGGGDVLYLGNSYGYVSTDRGRTFTPMNPGTVFGTYEGGFCCDQVLRYSVRVDRFLWLMQGNCVGGCPIDSNLGTNRYRLAVASPAQINAAIAAGQPPESAWHVYDLTTALFHSPDWFDYPDMAVSDTALYLMWDRVNTGTVMARMNLQELAASAPTPVLYWEHNGATFGRAVQDPGTTGYFLTNADSNINGQAALYSTTGNSPLLFTAAITHPAVPDVDFTSDTGFASPGHSGANWAIRAGGAPGGATLAGAHHDQLWFAWTAGRGYTRHPNLWAQPHIRYDGYQLPTLHHIGGGDLSNTTYAAEFPFLASDQQGDVGIAFAYGGPTTSVRPAAGILVGAHPGTAQSFFDIAVGDAINPATIPAHDFFLNQAQGDYSTIQPDGDNPTLFVTGGFYNKYDPPALGGLPRDRWAFARFGLGPEPANPTVTIQSPADGANLSAGASLAVHGTAVDWSGTPITGPTQLQWADNGAVIASGASATLAGLPAGTHVLTLSAVDAGGRTGVSTPVHVLVVAAPPGGAPSVTIDSPVNATNYPHGDTTPVTLAAHGTESSGAPLVAGDVTWSDTYRDASGTSHTVALGTGVHLTANLIANGTSSPTTNTVLATATDPVNHATATDTVVVTVGVYG